MDERVDLRVSVGLTGSASLPSSSPVSTDGLAFFFVGASASSSSSSSPIFGNDVLGLNVLVFATGAGTCLEDVALDGGLATLSFFSVVDSTADRRFRFDGRVSVGAGSIDALAEREDRLGGITQEWNGRWGKRACINTSVT